MQIREDAAREWFEAEHVTTFQLEHLFNPETKTLAGVWYLRKLLRRYGKRIIPFLMRWPTTTPDGAACCSGTRERLPPTAARL